jgi:release factor glutamine methyltransferase
VRLREALADAERRLREAGVDTPRVDAELLLAYVAGRSRTAVRASSDLEIDEAVLEPLLRRREAREPLAYVLGEWDFRRLTLKTDRRALVPRPETEILVERSLALLRDLGDRPRVLDLGVGGGAIALAIADECGGARVTGVDISSAALELARENANRLGLRVELRESGIEAAAEGWDLVVANPPYVRAEEWETLQPEIREWEPRAALVGDGVHADIARTARTRALALEAGDGQAHRVAGELEALAYRDITITPDLSEKERVVEGRRYQQEGERS